MSNEAMVKVGDELDWTEFTERYKQGEWRAPIFRDMVLSDIRRLGPSGTLTVVDIGCGRGFDDDRRFQDELAAEVLRYIGVEPDAEIGSNPVVQPVYHCIFEDAPIEADSVDVAFAVMVLEHLKSPEIFFDKLYETMHDGGVFWGFTIDARNWFAKASSLTKTLRIKDWYLNHLHGKGGDERYENYPVHYRCNTPERIKHYASRFKQVSTLNFHRIGQLDFYLPKPLRGLGRMIDQRIARKGLPGSIMAVRLVK